MRVDWIDPDSVRLYEQGFSATLHFSVQSATWYLTIDGGSGDVEVGAGGDIEVDADQRLAFTSEREQLAQLMESVREPLIAELEGRVRMFRDDTVDLALMGAKIAFRKAIRNL